MQSVHLAQAKLALLYPPTIGRSVMQLNASVTPTLIAAGKRGCAICLFRNI